MAFIPKTTFRIPFGRVGIIRSFSYSIVDGAVSPMPPLSGGWEQVSGSQSLTIFVDGVAAEGLALPSEPLGAFGWPDVLLEQECFVICPEGAVVQFVFGTVGDTVTVQLRVYGNLLPTHGLPPAFEVASMSNLEPM